MQQAISLGLLGPREVPSPRLHPLLGPLLGVLPELRKNQLDLDLRLAASLGEIFRYPVPVPGLKVYSVSDPELIKMVFFGDERNFIKNDFLLRRQRAAMGRGIFTTVGQEWRVERRAYTPLFTDKNVQGFESDFQDKIRALLQRWEKKADGAEIQLTSDMSFVTLAIALKTLYGIDFDPQDQSIEEAFREIQEFAQHALTSAFLLPSWIPSPRNRRLKRARGVIDQLSNVLLAAPRDPSRPDVLSLLTKGSKTFNAAHAVREQILNFILAAHDTSSATLSFTLYLLSLHPACLEQVQQELSQELAGQTPAFCHIERLSYMKAVVKEAMRLYPPAWTLQRSNVHEFNYRGFHFKPGSLFLLSQWLTHRNPRYWRDPEAFDPSRFLPDGAARQHPGAYFPFGLGPRSCIGSKMAMSEILLALASVLQKYRLVHVAAQKFSLIPGITLTTSPGIRMNLYRRGL